MAIAFVNGTATFFGGVVSNTSVSVAFNLVSGNTVVISLRNTTVGVLSVTDTAGNIYRFAGIANLVNNTLQEVWYCTNCVGNAANVITATLNSNEVNRGIAVVQFSGLATISPLDVLLNKVKSAGSANVTSDAFTTGVANSVVIACGNIGATGSNWTPDTGYTEAIEDASSVQEIQYQIFSAIQTAVTVTSVNADNSGKTQIVLSLHETLTSGGGGGEHSAVF